ncbi:MAG TPA: alkaline phosphatase family protein [Gaiellales bacterium]|nr:alkaline phosphatase family protein [Gaiellales bacterium]
MPKKLILAVVDGLGPALLDRSIAAGAAPTIDWLASEGSRTDRCCSTFPSLTPVCLSALITGRHPNGSLIPSMTWYHRGEGRFVEYGSSIAATLAEGTRQMMDDVLVNLNLLHLSPQVETVFERLDDAGLVTAAVNTFVMRGHTRHPISRPSARRVARRIGIVDAVYGPRRYFLGDLFFSDRTGAPINLGGAVDRHGGHVGRWLVTRDGFDFLFFYLYETDAVQHRGGDAVAAVAGADHSLELLVEAAGGRGRFLDRYAVAVVADHSQSTVERAVDAREPYADLRLFKGRRRSRPEDCDLAVAASNRVAMAYLLPGARTTLPEIVERARASAPADVVLHCDDGWYVAWRAGGELRFRRGSGVVDERRNSFQVEGDRELLDPALYPGALERIEGILACPRAGDVVVSAALGFEYRDAGGIHHEGGGSHGSLHAADSLVPLITAGFEGHSSGLPEVPSITDLTPMAFRHFGVG